MFSLIRVKACGGHALLQYFISAFILYINEYLSLHVKTVNTYIFIIEHVRIFPCVSSLTLPWRCTEVSSLGFDNASVQTRNRMRSGGMLAPCVQVGMNQRLTWVRMRRHRGTCSHHQTTDDCYQRVLISIVEI